MGMTVSQTGAGGKRGWNGKVSELNGVRVKLVSITRTNAVRVIETKTCFVVIIETDACGKGRHVVFQRQDWRGETRYVVDHRWSENWTAPKWSEI